LGVERSLEDAFGFGLQIVVRPAALNVLGKAFEVLVTEPEVLESGVGVLVWHKVWGKGSADLASSNRWGQGFRLPLSAAGRGASNRPWDRTHGAQRHPLSRFQATKGRSGKGDGGNGANRAAMQGRLDPFAGGSSGFSGENEFTLPVVFHRRPQERLEVNVPARLISRFTLSLTRSTKVLGSFMPQLT